MWIYKKNIYKCKNIKIDFMLIRKTEIETRMKYLITIYLLFRVGINYRQQREPKAYDVLNQFTPSDIEFSNFFVRILVETKKFIKNLF